MAKKSDKLKALRSIDDAMKVYATGTSKLHREIRSCLRILQAERKALTLVFDKRCNARVTAEHALAETTIREANEALEAQRGHHAENLKTGHKDLVNLSKTWLKVAERQTDIAKTVIASREKLTHLENSIDSQFETWIDDLISATVRGLKDEGSLETAMSIVSAGLIVAGATGGTSIAIAAAIASAALLAREMKARLTRVQRATARDREAVREEAALELMQAVARLCADWRTILK